jgi:ribosomal protein S18 acetylase RimI-like enzyme
MEVRWRVASDDERRQLEPWRVQALEAQLGLAGMPPERLVQLVALQRAGQQGSWRAAHPTVRQQAVYVGEALVASMDLAEQLTCVTLVDLVVDPARRGEGRGGAILRELQRRVASSGRCVRLSVRTHNPAQRLYLRAGFVVETHDDVHLRLVWPGPT